MRLLAIFLLPIFVHLASAETTNALRGGVAPRFTETKPRIPPPPPAILRQVPVGSNYESFPQKSAPTNINPPSQTSFALGDPNQPALVTSQKNSANAATNGIPQVATSTKTKGSVAASTTSKITTHHKDKRLRSPGQIRTDRVTSTQTFRQLPDGSFADKDGKIVYDLDQVGRDELRSLKPSKSSQRGVSTSTQSTGPYNPYQTVQFMPSQSASYYPQTVAAQGRPLRFCAACGGWV